MSNLQAAHLDGAVSANLHCQDCILCLGETAFAIAHFFAAKSSFSVSQRSLQNFDAFCRLPVRCFALT